MAAVRRQILRGYAQDDRFAHHVLPAVLICTMTLAGSAVHAAEDAARNNEFTVYRFARAVATEMRDVILSPIIPTLRNAPGQL